MLHDPPSATVPLFVDVDGTLTPADISIETLVKFACGSLFGWALLLWWAWRGRAVVKTMVARRQPVDAAALPYRAEVLALIAEARAAGRPVHLASASHWRNIVRVARHLGLDGDVLATRGADNMKAARKLAAIRARVGEHGAFDYAGDSNADRCLWHAARRGWSTRVVPTGSDVERIGPPPKGFARTLVKAMRPHQWAKNALVMVPALTSGLILVPAVFGAAAVAALCMSLIASAIYLINDLLDIDADRAHRSKRDRPLANGTLSIPAALVAAFVLAAVGLAGGWWLGGAPLLGSLVAYTALTTGYSFRFKAVMVADVIVLASLYTVRIWIGAVAIAVPLTFWLLLFSIFFFLSLAYLKRYIEMKDATDPARLVKGRGYIGGDLEIVMMSGMAAGMVAILVLALFANDMRGASRYATPELLWLLCLPVLYWINRIWMMARRGEVEGDPVAFAVRDRRSILIGGVMAAIFAAAQYLHLAP